MPNKYAEMIGTGFAAILKDTLSPEEFAEMQRINATPAYAKGVCASHEFCDANEPMAVAFELVTGRPVGVFDEADSALWGAAWDYAQTHYLTAREGTS